MYHDLFKKIKNMMKSQQEITDEAVTHSTHKVNEDSPSSSTSTSECLVAWWRIADVSLSSTKKVLSPAIMSSFAPNRVKIRSTGENSHSQAGI